MRKRCDRMKEALTAHGHADGDVQVAAQRVANELEGRGRAAAGAAKERGQQVLRTGAAGKQSEGQAGKQLRQFVALVQNATLGKH